MLQQKIKNCSKVFIALICVQNSGMYWIWFHPTYGNLQWTEIITNGLSKKDMFVKRGFFSELHINPQKLSIRR
jgi:hypothetical protein